MATSQTITIPFPTRLYISPLNPSLFASIVPATAKQSAANVSYHSIETYPEKTFGYIDLPQEEAQKVRKKWNGSFLRGMKVRVEEARPDKKRKAELEREEDARSNDVEAVVKKKPRKEKKRDGVIEAFELPDGRQVKRGWAQPAKEEKKKSRKDHAEQNVGMSQMIFRTKIPPNVASKLVQGKKSKTEDKQEKRESKEVRRSGKSAEVKEFSKSTKYPTFLRDSKVSSDVKRAATFVEGSGWVDAVGKIVDSVIGRTVRPTPALEVKPAATLDIPAPATGNITAAEEDDMDQEMPEAQVEDELQVLDESEAQEDVSKEDFEQISDEWAIPLPSITSTMASASVAQIEPANDAPFLTIDNPTLPQRAIHPLEALFKRPRPPTSGTSTSGTPSKSVPRPVPIVTNFSFLGSDDVEDGEEAPDEGGDSMMAPQTPFTKRDLESRGMRSAAPTPDTAAIGRRLKAPWTTDEEDDDEDGGEEEEEEEEDEDRVAMGEEDEGSATQDAVLGKGALEDGTEQTEFEKHFWEHRGEYNRGWKARKREARKEARQSENRRTGAGRVRDQD